MTRKDPSTEPARQTPYRRLYTKLYSFQDNMARQESCITYLLKEIRGLQKRVEQMEKRNEALSAAALRVAHNDMAGVYSLEQRGNLQVQEAGDQTLRHPPAGTRR